MEVNKVYQGDCLELMKGLPDKSVDLVLTDPPYGINAGGLLNKSYNKKHHSMASGRTDYGISDWDSFTPPIEYFNEIIRVSKKQVIFGGQYFTDKLPQTGKWIVWDKKIEEKYQNSFADVELAWTSENGASKIVRHLWHGMIQQDMANKEGHYHPTQKPLSVIEQILDIFSKEGDVVLDPFSGSCTTAIACINLKRKYICIEKEQKYVNICNERIGSQTQQMF